MLKYFQVWPEGLDKDNLFDSQKLFLVYLMGSVPEIVDWHRQLDYERKVRDIEENTVIKLTESDLDLANLQGRDIESLKRERLKAKKDELRASLRKEFGIKEKPKPFIRPSIQVKEEKADKKEEKDQKTKLWDMLHGKGLIKDG